jgi:hypothetical protein
MKGQVMTENVQIASAEAASANFARDATESGHSIHSASSFWVLFFI